MRMSSTPRRDTQVPTLTGMLLTTFALVGLAFAQPMLSVLGENPILFTTNNVDGLLLAIFAVGLIVVPTLLCWVPPALLSRLDERAGWLLHLGIATALLFQAAIQWMAELGHDGTVVRVLPAACVALGFGWLYSRAEPVRQWTRVLAILPLLALGLFLFSSPSGELVELAVESAN
jgi:hypothetical protein